MSSLDARREKGYRLDIRGHTKPPNETFHFPALSLGAASVVSFFACPSSVVWSFAFVSFSSSLSPKLKGSFSPIGDGSTVASGCHLLDLPPVDGPVLVDSDALFEVGISVGGPSWKDTLGRSGEGDEE